MGHSNSKPEPTPPAPIPPGHESHAAPWDSSHEKNEETAFQYHQEKERTWAEVRKGLIEANKDIIAAHDEAQRHSSATNGLPDHYGMKFKYERPSGAPTTHHVEYTDQVSGQQWTERYSDGQYLTAFSHPAKMAALSKVDALMREAGESGINVTGPYATARHLSNQAEKIVGEMPPELLLAEVPEQKDPAKGEKPSPNDFNIGDTFKKIAGLEHVQKWGKKAVTFMQGSQKIMGVFGPLLGGISNKVQAVLSKVNFIPGIVAAATRWMPTVKRWLSKVAGTMDHTLSKFFGRIGMPYVREQIHDTRAAFSTVMTGLQTALAGLTSGHFFQGVAAALRGDVAVRVPSGRTLFMSVPEHDTLLLYMQMAGKWNAEFGARKTNQTFIDSIEAGRSLSTRILREPSVPAIDPDRRAETLGRYGKDDIHLVIPHNYILAEGPLATLQLHTYLLAQTDTNWSTGEILSPGVQWHFKDSPDPAATSQFDLAEIEGIRLTIPVKFKFKGTELTVGFGADGGLNGSFVNRSPYVKVNLTSNYSAASTFTAHGSLIEGFTNIVLDLPARGYSYKAPNNKQYVTVKPWFSMEQVTLSGMPQAAVAAANFAIWIGTPHIAVAVRKSTIFRPRFVTNNQGKYLAISDQEKQKPMKDWWFTQKPAEALAYPGSIASCWEHDIYDNYPALRRALARTSDEQFIIGTFDTPTEKGIKVPITAIEPLHDLMSDTHPLRILTGNLELSQRLATKAAHLIMNINEEHGNDPAVACVHAKHLRAKGVMPIENVDVRAEASLAQLLGADNPTVGKTFG